LQFTQPLIELLKQTALTGDSVHSFQDFLNSRIHTVPPHEPEWHRCQKDRNLYFGGHGSLTLKVLPKSKLFSRRFFLFSLPPNECFQNFSREAKKENHGQTGLGLKAKDFEPRMNTDKHG